jgi:ectoine hydroxylase-related dioxygenase (phytanoyl-CoA dioxygenase family)
MEEETRMQPASAQPAAQSALGGFDLAGHRARLRAQGYTVIEDFLSSATLQAVREGLRPYLGTHQGRNNFEGYKTERVYTLVARGRVFEDIAGEPRVLALCGEFLKPGFLLTASQAICIHPGETAQPLHFDDTFYPLPRPRPAVSVSTIVAVDAFTADNGGTQIVPGSHAWSDAEVAGVYDGRDADAPTPAGLEPRLASVTMPAGACLVFLGTLLHRGGANRSAAPRLAFSNQYCEPWARTQENFFLGVPAERMRSMSLRLQQLLGYSIWPPFMGQVTASHPLKTLRADHVNAVLAQRADDSQNS